MNGNPSLIPGNSQERPKKTVPRERIGEVLSNADGFREQRRFERHRLRFTRGRLRNTFG